MNFQFFSFFFPQPFEYSVGFIIVKCRKIVTHFSHSACERLAKIQEESGCKVQNLIQDVVTGWNSTLLLLERILEQKVPLSTYATENDIPALNGHSYNVISNVVRLLKPFEMVTNMCTVQLRQGTN